MAPLPCLKRLNAGVSTSPAELAPVRPVLEFNMVDPRFIEESDVLADLDQRTNLMELTPSEFENLITNLFEKMGLETRLTQASRDGGVDCVAWDNRPIFGGKVVIQAKRYKHTVGVSAVRDLFGTVQNEGASKGILVTTSGYGKASHDFASRKPLELLDGSNLLALLLDHGGLEAKIEVPETWVDPASDGPVASAPLLSPDGQFTVGRQCLAAPPRDGCQPPQSRGGSPQRARVGSTRAALETLNGTRDHPMLCVAVGSRRCAAGVPKSVTPPSPGFEKIVPLVVDISAHHRQRRVA